MPPKQKAAKVKIRKKRWIRILAPRSFNQILLGETYVYEPRSVLGRILTVNLMTLTKDPKKQNMSVKFRATELAGDDIITEILGYYLSSSTIKRMVRRGKDRLDDSFLAVTQDGYTVRIKPFMTTITITKQSIRTALRKRSRQVIVSEMAKVPFEKALMDIISYSFQKNVKDSLKKIYPVKSLEIRTFEKAEGVAVNVEKPAAGESVPPGEEPVDAVPESAEPSAEEVPEEPSEEMQQASEEEKVQDVQE